MCDPSELKKLPKPPRVVPADGAADVLEPDELDEPEPPESEELKNDRELW